ncbi:hypothetical protein [Streptomyces sp. NPDC049915]
MLGPRARAVDAALVVAVAQLLESVKTPVDPAGEAEAESEPEPPEPVK